jgi:hypothetical protein
LESIKGDQTGAFNNEATPKDTKYPKQIFGIKGAIYKEHSRYLSRTFDSNGDWIETDASRPDVKQADLKKYFRGMFNEEEVDRLTPEDYKKMESKEFD